MIQELLNRGFSQTEAAGLLGTTKQNVQYHLKKGGARFEDVTAQARNLLPWDVDLDREFNRATPYLRALWHAEYRLTRGNGMSESKLRYLRQWYDRMTEFVLEYDPSIPPHRGVATGGWVYRPREKRDGDLLVRVNEYTKFGRGEKKYWRLPSREEWPDA